MAKIPKSFLRKLAPKPPKGNIPIDPPLCLPPIPASPEGCTPKLKADGTIYWANPDGTPAAGLFSATRVAKKTPKRGGCC